MNDETLDSTYSEKDLEKITTTIGNFLYELNVDSEEADMEGERLVSLLLKNGFKIVSL